MTSNSEYNRKKYLDLIMSLDDDNSKTIDESQFNKKNDTSHRCRFFNPNIYRDSFYILLQQELVNQYYNKELSSKIIKKEVPRLNFILPQTKKKVVIDVEIKDIDDLIKIIEENPVDESIDYNINIESLHKIKPYLNRLKNMIGMNSIKKNILDQILYFIQDFHVGGKGTSRGDYLHTVIYGPPGTGKTHVAKIIGKIFSKLGILKKGVFKKVTRSDLVAGYLGQTALKTKDVINECLDGVLFIDEAYSLGNAEKKDSFSKECIDTLCEALSSHKENLMVIIAGYETELNDCFFNFNKGLDSRFTWRFKIDDYTGSDLYKIFLKKITDYEWKFDDSLKEIWFVKHLPYFTFFGRDMEVLFSKTKISHSRRVFGKSVEEKKTIIMKDVEKGFDMFMDNDEVKKRKETETHKLMMNTLYV